MLTSTIVDPTAPAPPLVRRLDHLRALEAESIHIIREVVAEFERPVMLYSIGKDSSVLLRLAQKAFYPGPIPFPLLHIDTTYKFREMIEFRDWYANEVGARLIVHTNEAAIADGTQPFVVGTQRCCGLLKTERCSTRSKRANSTPRSAAPGATRSGRARRSASSRCAMQGQWDPKSQRPELWHLLNGRLSPGESIRVFPLSNWTELDVWQYIHVENIPIVPLYFAQGARGHRPRELAAAARAAVRAAPRPAKRRSGDVPDALARLFAVHRRGALGGGHGREDHRRARGLRQSERQLRVIDHDQDGSMEVKKREGYF